MALLCSMKNDSILNNMIPKIKEENVSPFIASLRPWSHGVSVPLDTIETFQTYATYGWAVRSSS